MILVTQMERSSVKFNEGHRFFNPPAPKRKGKVDKVADNIEGNGMKVDNICILSCVNSVAEIIDNQLLHFTPKSCRTIL